MDNNLIMVLGTLLVIFLLILIASIGVGLYILIKKNPDLFKKSKEKTNQTQAVAVEAVIPEVLEENCINHPNINADSLCAICMGAFCERCTIQDNGLNFCTKHYKVYTDNKWGKLEEIRTTPEEAHASEYLYKFKNSNWSNNQIPMIIMTHYQINVDQDQIESEISLLAPESQILELKKRLSASKKIH